MKRKTFLLLVLTACIALIFQGCEGAATRSSSSTTPASTQPSSSATTGSQPKSTAPPAPPFVQESFVNRRMINYVSSDPANNSLLQAPPERVTIHFSKGLAAGSFIEVTTDGRSCATGQVYVAPDTLSMYVPVAAGVTGNYKVKFAAYFSSGYYEEGSFGFSVKIP